LVFVQLIAHLYAFAVIGLSHAEFLSCPGEQLDYRQRTARVGAQPKQLSLTKAGVIGYFCSDPIWLFERLLFIRKLYLSQNNPSQIAIVNIDGPCESSIRDPVPASRMRRWPR
jgi:hypothetical protein